MLAVNGRDCASPARQGFLEVERDGVDEIVVLALKQRVWFLHINISYPPCLRIQSHGEKGGGSYLFNHKMQVLTTSLDLIANLLELNLGSLLEAGLDGHLEDLVLCGLLPVRVITLGLDLHPLLNAVVKILQRQGQRPLDGQDLGVLRSLRATCEFRPGAAAAGVAVGVEDVFKGIHASHATTHATATVPHKVGKDILRVGEVEAIQPRTTTATAATTTTGREVESPSTSAAAATARHPAKVEALAGVASATIAVGASSEGVAARLGALGWGLVAAEEEFEAVLVVDLALLGVGEDFVRLRAFLELLGGLGVVLVLVGVVFQSGFSVGEKKVVSMVDEPRFGI